MTDANDHPTDPENTATTPDPIPKESPPPIEDPPAKDPPAKDPPVEAPPVEDPPVEAPPVEEPPAKRPPVEEPPPPIEAMPPVITDVEPTIGPISGGTLVTVKGRNFESGCKVELGGALVAEVMFESATRLRFVTPSRGEIGPAELAVSNPTGPSHNLPNAFFYRAETPHIESVTPAEGPNAGGTTLTVRGRHFNERCEAFVCGIQVAVTFKGPGELEVVTPPVRSDGSADVRVKNPDEQAHTAERIFRYHAPLPPPVLGAVSPNKGAEAGGLKVAILGDDFAEGVTVRFGSVPATVKFLTRKELEAMSPPFAGAREVDVEVINPDGASAKIESAFAYESLPPPVITSVSPPNGPTIGGTRLVIEGEHFTQGSLVYIGREYPKDLAIKSATEIHAITAPRKTPGVVDVEVSVPGLPRAVKKNAYRYDAVPAPTLTSVSPNRIGTSGGTVLTLAGQNFLKETLVLIDGKTVKTVKFIDKSTLEVKAPGGEGGKMVDVAVRNPDGKEAVQKRAVMFDPRYG